MSRRAATWLLCAGGRGQVEMRGSVWQGHNRGEEVISAGDRARVVATHGLVLELRRES